MEVLQINILAFIPGVESVIVVEVGELKIERRIRTL